MYDVGGDRRWEPRQSWYDHLYEGWVLGPYYFLMGLLSLFHHFLRPMVVRKAAKE